MRRSTVAAVATAVALAGCPLPQPLPTYPAGTITPPRILSATTTAGVESITPVPSGCAAAPSYPLDATIFYQESVILEARWFVDYRPDVQSRWNIQNSTREVPPNPDALVLDRPVPTFTFSPYGFPPPPELGTFPDYKSPGIVHVVELVVSNGFAAEGSPEYAQQPNRAPGTTPDGASQFEIQTYRWIFVNVPNLPCP